MLSDNLRKYIKDVDQRDPKSKQRRALYGLFFEIASELSNMRKRKGISQRELAEMLNTSHPTIVRWETPGYSGYTLSKLIDMTDALDCRIDLKIVPKEATVTNIVDSPAWGDDISLIYAEAKRRAAVKARTLTQEREIAND